jgi:hypothetical protein
VESSALTWKRRWPHETEPLLGAYLRRPCCARWDLRVAVWWRDRMQEGGKAGKQPALFLGTKSC